MTKTAKQFEQYLIKIDACPDARKWAKGKTAKEAWEQCHRGDWLLWWSRKQMRTTEDFADADLCTLTLAKGECAKTVYHLMKDERSRKAVDAAIAFGKGEISRDELDKAYAAAYDATDATDAAADAAADAVDAAAADVGVYAAAAAYAQASMTARKENQQKTADIVRSIIIPNFL